MNTLTKTKQSALASPFRSRTSTWLAYSLSLLLTLACLMSAKAQTTWVARTAPANGYNSVAYGNGKFVVVQNGAAPATSTDGITWTGQTSPSSYWTAVTFGNGLFVAVSYSGIGVMTSPDGITWTSQTSPASPLWESVTYGNGLFVAVAPNRVMTSPNGITWTLRTPASGNNWYGVTYGNSLFVAVSTNGTNRVMTSPDGITWTSRNASVNNSWSKVTFGNGLFVAVSTDGTNRVMTSPDGITWTSRNASVNNAWRSVAYGDNNFVALSNDGIGNRVMSSPDGINWTSRASTADIDWKGIGFGNGLFVAVAYSQAGIMTSSTANPEINLQGNATNIADGDTSPATTDHTLFVPTAVNGNSTRIYTIQNTDAGTLNVTNVAISGTDAGLFSISGLPAFPFDINGSSSQTFTVTFAPTSAGTKDATITITNSDADESSYDFAIRGVGAILNTFVSTTGSDANNGTSVGTPKLTIANAYTTVDEGGTINIATGPYNETITITKNITFATTGTVTVQNLTINMAGKTLTLSAPLQVSRVVALQAGTIASNGNLVLASNATESALLDDFTTGYAGTITGNIQVQRYLNNTNAGTRIFSSPVGGMTASQLASDVYTYNESIVVGSIDNGWQSTAGTISLVPFRGYRVLQTATGNQTYTFVGTPNTGAYTAPLTRQVANGTNTAAGYTAVGNPYPSPINWVAVAALPANAGQITGIASIYKTSGLATGVWATVNSGGVGTNGATRWIPSGEGFLVRRSLAGTSTYNITNATRSNVYTNNNNFLREEEKPLVRLQMSNGTFADEALVYAEKEATGKIDIGLDAEKLAGDADKPYLSFVHNQQDWAITALSNLPTGLSMPIAIRGQSVYTLSVTEKTALNENLYLYDRKVGKLHNLVEGYTFQANGAENNRFVLYVGKPSDEQLAQVGEAVRVWSYDKTIYLHFADANLASQAQVQVSNVQGQTVSTYKNLQDANTQLQTTLPTGAYIVRVQTPQGIVTKKIVIE